jgi:aminomuconate-semialdehyde/2-hydroxymuconate-6-semialdehyde dehydrogenase
MPLSSKTRKKIANYIGGELVPPINGKYFDNYNPATGAVYSQTPDSNEKDVVAAVKAAEKAFPEWSVTPIENRSRILTRIADLIEQNLDIIANAESVDNGKPLSLAKNIDIPRSARNFRFYANGIVHFDSKAHIMSDTAVNYTIRHPLGVVGCISPWNLPLYLFTWKIAPAIAAGCTVVAKPSEVTPVSAYLLSEICIEAGLPPGVLNIVHGYGPSVGRPLTSHPKVKAISFTGGTQTGKEIAKTAAPMFKKTSLEMGGKNPNIIFADCDFDEMMRTTIRSSFQNQGQICLCGSRIFVERPIYEKFKEEFVKRTKKLKVGDPMAARTRQGAVVSKDHYEKILSYIELAKEEGGTILAGGKPATVGARCKDGWFIEPTIVEGLKYKSRTNQEEVFGPFVTIMPFDTEEEVIKYANSTEYGLAASIWTQNLSRAHRVARHIDSGIIWVNCWLVRDLRTAFGGMKNSGLGREGGWHALEFFTEPKNVCITI